MSERKVLNKYYDPEFDPSKLIRAKRPKNGQFKVRMMLPMSIRCSTCGEWLYRGKKFNARKEDVAGEDYLGIKIFRFYFRCITCAAELTIRTDPKNADYECEHGCTRNYEPWRTNRQNEEKALKELDEEEIDPMKALENRTEQNKRELELLDALEEIQDKNKRAQTIDANAFLEQREADRLKAQEEEDEEKVRQAFANRVVRLHDEEDKEEEEKEGVEDEEKEQKSAHESAEKKKAGSKHGVKRKAAMLDHLIEVEEEEEEEKEQHTQSEHKKSVGHSDSQSAHSKSPAKTSSKHAHSPHKPLPSASSFSPSSPSSKHSDFSPFASIVPLGSHAKSPGAQSTSLFGDITPFGSSSLPKVVPKVVPRVVPKSSVGGVNVVPRVVPRAKPTPKAP